MYNTDLPSRAELPSTARLLRSTAIAACVAAALLVTVVLPAEYNIDPTGIGRVLGLTEMGEIKTQLAREAEADRQPTPPVSAPDRRSSLLGTLFARLVFGSAVAQPAPTTTARSDETTVVVKAGQGIEYKMDMRRNAQVTYSWTAEGGTVNYDMHGEPPGNPDGTKSYARGRGAASDKGVLTAPFDGNHGWFWRNRGTKDVTVRLTTRGEYGGIKRVD